MNIPAALNPYEQQQQRYPSAGGFDWNGEDSDDDVQQQGEDEENDADFIVEYMVCIYLLTYILYTYTSVYICTYVYVYE
jgi:hypothetical protein